MSVMSRPERMDWPCTKIVWHTNDTENPLQMDSQLLNNRFHFLITPNCAKLRRITPFYRWRKLSKIGVVFCVCVCVCVWRGDYI